MGLIFETRRTERFAPDHTTGETIGLGTPDLPLSNLRSGNSGIVRRLDGGEDFRSQMLALGIIPGKLITVARGEKNHPYIIRIDDNKVMIDWMTLGQIYIQPNADRQRKKGWF